MTFSARSLHLELQGSRLLAAVLVFVHGLALWTLMVNGLFSAVLSIFLSLAIAISLVDSLRRSALLTHRDAVRCLSFYDGEWQLGTTSGESLAAELKFPLYVSYLFIVLPFRTATGKRHVVIARDALNKTDYRRSRVFFRYRPGNEFS